VVGGGGGDEHVGDRAGAEAAGEAKWTSLFCRVRPVRTARPCGRALDDDLLGATDPGPVPGQAAPLDHDASRSKRSATTSAGTKASAMPNASVPGRGLKTNV
jgi:hypothetical protein